MPSAVDQVMVSVAGDSLPQVLDDLREAGLVVDTVLEALGVVTGTVQVRAIPALLSVPGVLDVERQWRVQLPPY
ncbi:hypothetical protein SAMN05216188_110101 [Lentzea xinjiangensis]|uniref:Ketohydroxyglutarate aldolase n=1 Tax=Lentzea xinjiangensis TaxID=402600 RepID=A0A1H9NA03_9PSEU|nr:hypothetical protein [Lentzea xinjiangensis]SER32774.1 hypothetical protein SAMN05216188_110101 [Lentzea xinjiangensis]